MKKKSMGVEAKLRHKDVSYISLEDLDLDVENPRFGEDSSSSDTQVDVLNNIVKNYGVTDVISSIAVNGYFSAEPMVVRKNGNKRYTVMEGNRRLAACLILKNDDRARDQVNLHQQYITKYISHGEPKIDPIPAIIFEDDDGIDKKSLISYLGVRHIVSTKDWDSYAKAAWIARTIKDGDMSVSDISTMIGDRNSTIKRLLSGYNFIKQMESTGKYNKDDSVKKGRGSNTSYPFSWVYTLLGYKSIQDFVGLSEDPTISHPINENKLDNAKLLMTAMFGNKNKGQNSQVKDSRNLGVLAEIVASPEKIILLKQGKAVDEINDLTQPIGDRLTNLMLEIRGRLDECITRVGREDLSSQDAINLNSYLEQISKQFRSFRTAINNAISGNDSEGF
ncbi:TPA: ParB N-terminal domain-containing protein [Morganella morganii]|uniref:ParB N-terminal domain-containing protein n=1 Tax=Morganella morganii TaxID=582 RepID=UPI0023DD7515|nr:ParB N-terminal domain-containing protein [Morganella morganii]ELF0883593.1 ParB N-terminal domain-containing protein [Morganella morganii]MDF2406281.1 ParB N-terminal domain-containing protein [Morganella morganii]MDU3418966.1 ParB N-terminal domain-containing protein [Morganella morganii]MDU3449324.1 ParB N-terminal domain-containing protein [Morganella morganii]MDU3506060.1 ParB N-terminal domain-containing protein [Morganella morganii]